MKRGLPLGADSSGNLYFYLGSESGAVHLLPNYDHEVADAKSAWFKFPPRLLISRSCMEILSSRMPHQSL